MHCQISTFPLCPCEEEPCKRFEGLNGTDTQPQPQGAAQVLEDRKELELRKVVGGHLHIGIELDANGWVGNTVPLGHLGVAVD